MLANKVDPKDFEYFANLRVKEYKNETFGLRILNEWKEVDRIYRLFGHLHKGKAINSFSYSPVIDSFL